MADSNAAIPNAIAAGHAHYTLCGEPAAEARVVQDLSRLATGIDSEVGDAMRALVLTGPFARAEGGIAVHDGEPRVQVPGYELLSLFKHKPERRQLALDMMAATWSRLLGARVAIRAIGTRDLAQTPATCFWFHAGRRQLLTLSGDPTLVSSIARIDAADLRGDEAAFVLCERLAALALTTLEPRTDPARAVRAMQRALLACGDAHLLFRGQYADTLKARAEALDNVCTSAALRSGYRNAIAWSARPDVWLPEAGDVQNWLASTRRWLCSTYLDMEAERIGSARDLAGYVAHPDGLHTAATDTERRLRARLTRAFLHRPSLLATVALQPLDRLLRCSVALAFGSHLPACRQKAAALLRVPGSARTAPDDRALAQALRALASDTLDDPHGHPFGEPMIFVEP